MAETLPSEGPIRRRASLAGKIIIGVGVILIVASAAVWPYTFLFPTLRDPAQIDRILWLDQGWTSDQRQKYYRTPQGSLIIPYSWFLALEQPGLGNHQPFGDEANLLRYDLLPDRGSRFNPDHLPIGLSKQTVPGEYLETLGCGAPPCAAGVPLHRIWLSYTCAACHTSILTYKGRNIGIDGGRGRWNFTAFNTAMANLLLLTRWTPSMFNRFAAKVLEVEKRSDTPERRTQVKRALQAFLIGPAIVNGIKGNFSDTYPTDEGFGRIDAFGRAANAQFAPLDKKNILPANAPVLIPPLWHTHDFDWVQSVASIRQPLGRNISESWGVSSAVDLADTDTSFQFSATQSLPHLFWMETLISVMNPPVWPEQVFGTIDQEAVQLGRYLYEEKVFDRALSPREEQWCADSPGTQTSDGGQPCPNPNRPLKGLCARCHAPVAEVYANEYGKRYWQLPLYKLEVIGTDPADAVNFNARHVYTGKFKAQFGGKERVHLGEALQLSTSAIMAREFEHQGIPPEDQPTVTGFRQNNFRAPLAYPARPLPGYWATPPYLHNGSVPNMYELLSPVEERSASFWAGDLEFDPINLGYRSTRFKGGFEFQTRRSVFGALGYALLGVVTGRPEYKRAIDGNSNLGHEFRNAPKGARGVIGPYLTPKERRAVIEYMKVMPELRPVGGDQEVARRRALLKAMEEEYAGSANSRSAARKEW